MDIVVSYLSNPWYWAVAVLIIFAAIDLVVGVTNDAVNFLNSSFGSKVASRKTILWIAAAGIFVGAFLSGGMMEIARKGIFNPALFTFYDIIIVFFSVVMASAIILDIYNRLKLPTSTTVLIVFELLGAGLAITLIHLFQDDLTISRMSEFIHGSKTITIISGIFLSVVIAFVTGWLIQTIVRSLVTFNYKAAIDRRGWIFGGISISVIIYFLVVKGLKQTPWFPQEAMGRMIDHALATLGILFVAGALFTIVFQRVWKGNILKVIVLLGTFSLAAAFAGNDLVNFIGVPIAGFQAIMIYINSGTGNLSMLMGGLIEDVATPQIFLIGAALIMIVTLLSSKRIQAISSTELGLTKHATGQEQFKPGRASRWIVKKTIKAHKKIISILPVSWQESLAGRFISTHYSSQEETAAYDLIRASVNLTLSAILIALATTMKLPLSTTYVTFMVAMGTALADGAWGRDSAVYRISGVLTIIGSWFMTAIVALVLTVFLTLILWRLGFRAIALTMLGIIYLLYHSYKPNKSSTSTQIADILLEDGELSEVLQVHTKAIIPQLYPLLDRVILALIKDDDVALNKLDHEVNKLTSKTKTIKHDIYKMFNSLSEEATETGHIYVQGIEVLRKATLALGAMSQEAKEYVLNGHPELIDDQAKELKSLSATLKDWLAQTQDIVNFDAVPSLRHYDKDVEKLLNAIDEARQMQFARIKNGKVGIRNTTLYTAFLTEMYTIVINIQKLLHYRRRMQVQK